MVLSMFMLQAKYFEMRAREKKENREPTKPDGQVREAELFKAYHSRCSLQYFFMAAKHDVYRIWPPTSACRGKRHPQAAAHTLKRPVVDMASALPGLSAHAVRVRTRLQPYVQVSLQDWTWWSRPEVSPHELAASVALYPEKRFSCGSKQE